MKTNHILLLGSLLLLLFNSSCLIVEDLKKQADLQYGREFQKDTIFPDGPYIGLNSIVAEHDTTNIIMVHGLKTKSPNHFKYLRETLAKELHFTSSRNPTLLFGNGLVPDLKNIKPLQGRVTKYEYEKEGGKKLIFYDIFWSPVTSPVKEYLKEQFDAPKQQTRLANYLKDEYLIDAFGDMALYLNEGYKEEIQKPFKVALEHLKGDNNVLIAGGFGSQILFDVLTLPSTCEVNMLTCVKAEINKVGLVNNPNFLSTVIANHPFYKEEHIQFIKNLVDSLNNLKNLNAAAMSASLEEKIEKQRVSIPAFANKKIQHVFLISNQLPFTSLMTLGNGESNKEDEYIRHLYSDLSNYALFARIKKMDIVSFFESSDAFGYKLPRPLPIQQRINVVNVLIENAYSLTFNPDKLTRDYLSPRIKDKKLKNALFQFIDQEHTKQKLMFNIEGPAEFARYSDKVVNGLLKNGAVKTKDEPSLAMPNPPKPNKGGIKRYLERMATDQLEQAQKEINMTSSTLPFRLPSRHISDFDGIRKSVESNEVTQVLTIHGMRYAEPNHFDEMISLIAKKLDFYTTPTCDVDYYFDETGNPFPNEGKVAGTGSVRVLKYENANGKSLVFYSVYWAPITLPPKQWLNNICKDSGASVTSQTVKKQIVNDGLGDVVLAFNEFDQNIYDLLDKAINLMEDRSSLICKVVRAVPDISEQRNTYMISGSLGSRILYDYILDSTVDPSHLVNNVLKKTDKIFMLTNQIGLIGIKDLSVQVPKAAFDAMIFDSLRLRLRNIPANIELVAFNDPNDILSFKVPELNTTELKVKHVYINLAQGFQVNMNGLIKYIYKADKMISGRTIMGRIFEKKRRVYTNNYYSKLERQYNAEDLFPDKINRFMLFKNKEFKKFKAQLDAEHQKEKEKIEAWDFSKKKEKRKALSNHKKSRLNNYYLKKLKKKTIMMALLRTLVNGKAYQDFVVDFDTAHNGPKKNNTVIQMICEGSYEVKRTNTRNE